MFFAGSCKELYENKGFKIGKGWYVKKRGLRGFSGRLWGRS